MQESPWHEQALAAITSAHQAGRTLWVSRQVMREYLVTMTRPQAFANLPQATVLSQLERFGELFQIADDTAAVTEALLKLLKNYAIGGKQVHDANIVATMQVQGIRHLLTHNEKDFARFGDVLVVEGIVNAA